jgi:FSR family fosmidomycin resistance protein-like MFS transporter
MVQAGFIFSGSMGIMLGGWMSDRMRRLPLLIVSLAAPVPILLAALQLGGVAFVTLLLLGNFLMQAASPIYLVLAQEAMPTRRNIASSLAMGAAWGAAGLATLPIGAIAGSLGLVPVLKVLAILPLVALPLMLLLSPEAPSRAKPATL